MPTEPWSDESLNLDTVDFLHLQALREAMNADDVELLTRLLETDDTDTFHCNVTGEPIDVCECDECYNTRQ